MLDECRGGEAAAAAAAQAGGANVDGEFDRFDDEQFLSMFSDEIGSAAVAGPTVSSSNPSTPSDHNSINDEKEMQLQKQQQVKNESEEVESQCETDSQANQNGATANAANDRMIDPKRVKR